MKATLIVGAMICVVLIVATATSRGDTPATDTTVSTGGDGTGNGQNLHGHRGQHVGLPPDSSPPRPPPFTMTDPGPTSALWMYDQLTATEKAQVDRNRDTSTWDAINSAYATAIVERANAAAAQSASYQLGLLDLGEQGIVP